MKRFLLVIVLITSSALSALSAETLIFRDEFTGSNGTDLVSHTPDTGSDWDEAIDTAGSLNIQIQSNQGRASAASSSNQLVYVANPAPSTPDMRVRFTLNTWHTGANDPIGLVARYQDANNYYAARTCQFGGDIVVWIDALVGGTPTELNGDVVTIEPGDVIDFVLVGDRLSVEINSVEVLSTTHSGIPAAGRGGVHLGRYPGWPDADITTNWLLDDFEIYEITLDAERRIW